MATITYEELQMENRRLRELEKLRARVRTPPFVKPRHRTIEPRPPGHQGTRRLPPERVDEEWELKLANK